MEVANIIPLEDVLISLVKKRKWQEMLKLSDLYPATETSRFLWAWPTEACLKQLKNVFQRKGISSVLSIGCGSGLLEWIIQQSTGNKYLQHKSTHNVNFLSKGTIVNGVELDKSWWTSSYSPATFINMNFVSNKPITSKFLNNCVTNADDPPQEKHSNFALLFCYFNNRPAFNDYVRVYDGNYIIIVGPDEGLGTFTDPLPLSPQFENCVGYKWNIETFINIDNFNYIAVYKKCMK